MRAMKQPGFLSVATILLPACLTGCGDGTKMQHTNATQTEQLNQIADNTAEDAGQGAAQNMSDPTLGGGVATKPRKY